MNMFKERTHCCVEDFLNLCNNAYTKYEMIKLELDVLRRLKFDIGFPLAYRFLRRYSNVSIVLFTESSCHVPMKVVELFRFKTTHSLCSVKLVSFSNAVC